MNRRWRVGLLGAGYIADAHARAVRDIAGAKLTAVCDRAFGRATELATRFKIPGVFASLEEMLASDVDVVHVLLPPDAHVGAARQVLGAGRHVFLEKPMGLSAAECQALVDQAANAEKKLGVSHNFLFVPAYEQLRSEARDGTLGRIDQITVNWLFPLGLLQFGPFDNWMLREPRNLFFEIGPHLMAYLFDLAGEPDRWQVDAFRPLDLPGGGRVYRQWHVHAVCGNVAVDMNLAVTPGATDRSISVRGHAATARCAFDRNLYLREEPQDPNPLFDNFGIARLSAWQTATGALQGLVKGMSGTLRKAPSANPFGESIARCMQVFYAGLEGELDRRIDGTFGHHVIAACERVVESACLVSRPHDPHAWTVSPPQGKPTVLVLGGTGFIGKRLVQALVATGKNVRVVTRSRSAGAIALAGLPVDLVEGSLADPALLDRALEGIDIVYHLAKATGKRWEDYYYNDVLVTKNVAERAVASGVRRFLYTGTIDSYYSGRAGHVIDGQTPLDPKIDTRNHYARSKATCERLLLDFQEAQGLPLVILRPGIVIGKGCPAAHWGVGMFESETRVRFWGDGANKLPLVLVDDVADALLRALDQPNIEGQAFLLTDEPLLSAREYVEIVSRESGSRLRAQPTPIWRFFLQDLIKETAKHAIRHPNRKVPSYRDWASRSHRARYDASKTKQLLGWQPAGTRDALIQRGIVPAVRDALL